MLRFQVKSALAATLMLVLALQSRATAQTSESADTQGLAATGTAIAGTATAPRKVRIGLALGGGGARGAAEVGVMKVLKQEGVPIDIIAGTSIGAVVGGLYSAGVSLDTLEKKFDEGTFMKKFMPIPLVFRIVLAPVLIVPRLVGIHPYDGLYRSRPIISYVDKLTNIPDCSIEKLPLPYAAVATNLRTGLSQRITNGNLGWAIAASTAVPGLKKPIQINDQLYCDGGLSCNIPVPHVREMGADFVIAVNIDEHLKNVPLEKFRAMGSVSKQALRIQLANGDRPLVREADFVIHPDVDGITLISRNNKDGYRGIAAGVKAAREAMPELRRRLAAIGVVLPPSTSSQSTQ